MPKVPKDKKKGKHGHDKKKLKRKGTLAGKAVDLLAAEPETDREIV